MKKFATLFALASCVMALSCNSDDDGPSPFVIVDEQGLVILLEWSTGGGFQKAIDDADLDMDLVLGSIAVRVSSGSTSFEEITLAHRFSDGDYKVDIDYSSGEEAVDFSVFVNPLSGEGQNFEATGSFSREQAGNMVLSSFLTINKTDSMYTISRN